MSEQQSNYPRAKSVPPVKHITSLPYVFRPFPAARYHPDGRSMLVHSQEQADGLGEEWSPTPFPPQPAGTQQKTDEQNERLLTALNEEVAAHAETTQELANMEQQSREDLADRDEQIADLQPPAAKPKKRK
ncbi:MAG: hypothetical protein ABSD56_00575 [Bryobacteraceae bacterium]|jgi:hypothetical protein